jgi:hypothetical protein
MLLFITTLIEMNYQLLWPLGLRPVVFQRVVIATDFLMLDTSLFPSTRTKLSGPSRSDSCNDLVAVVSSLAALARFEDLNTL